MIYVVSTRFDHDYAIEGFFMDRKEAFRVRNAFKKATGLQVVVTEHPIDIFLSIPFLSAKFLEE